MPSFVIRGTTGVFGEATGGIAGGRAGEAVERIGEGVAGGLDAVGRDAGKALGGLLERDGEEEDR